MVNQSEYYSVLRQLGYEAEIAARTSQWLRSRGITKISLNGLQLRANQIANDMLWAGSR